MMKKRSKIQKHLAKMVLAALLCTGGVHCLISPAVAYADFAPGTPSSGGGGSLPAITITVTDASDPINHAEGGVMTSKTDSGKSYYTPSNAVCTTLNITGGTGNNRFAGYYSTTEDVAGHTVNLSGSATIGSLYGGYVDGAFSANNNNLNISGDATTVSAAFGGRSNDGAVNGNTVTISGGAPTVTDTVCGGLSMNSNATENRVVIKGGNFGSIVIGGHTTNGKNATDNTVTIEDGTITRGIYGGLSQNGTAGTAINNKVIINGGIINGIVKGGESDKGNATNNTVTIKGGTVTERVIGGNANISGDANGNTITISGGTIGKEGAGTSIWGGYASSGGASNNTVTISGDVQLLGNVSIYGAEVHGTTDVANANNNTVNISRYILRQHAEHCGQRRNGSFCLRFPKHELLPAF